jgi:argininosuccinate lyase
MHPALEALSNSLEQDRPLADADLRASAAYARALARCGVLRPGEAEVLSRALEGMRADLAAGRWTPGAAEDVHSAIEVEVTRRTGELGERLHTGRSRNDQVATAFRLAVREETGQVLHQVRGLQAALVRRAEGEIESLVPAFTHLQRAQPIRLAHWLLAHFWPLERDAARLAAAAQRASVLPLGSGAVSGHAFGLDREALAADLGFHGVSENSLDAVGDRDFALDFAFACSMAAVHLSRLAEELVIWSSSEFGFVRWPDALATGSSLMPNKKNPDLCELVRGHAAGAIGDLVSLLVLLKGLPTSYQRDLQEDKPPVWRLARATRAGLEAMTAALDGVEFDRERMHAALSDDVLATEAADALVARGVPFRRAHRAVAEAVAQARRHGMGLRQLARHTPRGLPEPLEARDLLELDFETAVERRTAAGGTARAAVRAQLERARSLVEGAVEELPR